MPPLPSELAYVPFVYHVMLSSTLPITLQSHGRVQPALRRGAHQRKRPRRPMVGMMLHQDGSTHQWLPDQWWDLIVTMDDANSKVYSAFFVPEEGTMSSFRALTEVIETHGLFYSLYTDRGSHYWQRFPIKFKLSGPAANLGARHGPAGIVRFGGTAVLFRRLPGR